MAGKQGIYEKWVKGRRRKSVRLEVLTIFLIFIVIIMGVSLMIYNQNISELRQADINHLTESSWPIPWTPLSWMWEACSTCTIRIRGCAILSTTAKASMMR